VTEDQPDLSRDLSRRGLILSLAVSTIAGTALRLWGLRGQVLGGDELHAVRAVTDLPLGRILTTYLNNDASIPLTALFRFLLDHGATLSETAFRMPALLCGLLALVALPLALGGLADRATTAILGWLVALSPGLVLYSRIARSYLPMVLAATLAVVAFERWWRTGSWKAGAAYVLLGAAAVWLHLGAAPFVASPFLFAAGDLLLHRDFARLRRLILLGLLLTLGFAAFLVPAGPSLARLVRSKHRQLDLPLESVGYALHLEAGTASPWVEALFWTLAVAGLVLLLRRRPRAAAFTLTLAAGHVVGMLLLSPMGIGHPLVLNRYLLPVLPLVLLWLAAALAPGAGYRAARWAGAALVLALLAAAGPFPGFRGSSFVHHNDFVGYYLPLATAPDLPPAYAKLPAGPVVEFPWPTAWEYGRSFYAYQRLHGRRVLVSAPADVPRVPGIRLRNEVPPEPAALLASPGAVVVVHLRLAYEESRVVIPNGRIHRPMPPPIRRFYRRMGEKLAARLEAEWGEPDFADDRVRIWDLERLRREGKH
jgi:hypothetical protein